MTGLETPLESIRPAFQGIIPTPVATASPAGVPNSTYMSVAWYVDEERIALSNQFLGKTIANLRANPLLALRVVDPTTMFEYEIDATHLRSETSGELFEAVRTQVEAVASQSGMEDVFRLRAVEVLRVDRCAPAARPTPATATKSNTAGLLAGLDTFVRRLAETRDLDETTRVALQSLEDIFGFRRSILLLADPSDEHLLVVAANGHAPGNLGAEIPFGEGIVGVAAHRRRTVQVADVARLSRAGTTVNSTIDAPPVLASSGLDDAVSVLATPLILHDRLVGVLYLDSPQPGRFDSDDAQLVGVLGAHLASSIALHEGGGLEPLTSPPAVAAAEPRDAVNHVAFYDHDGTVLIDGRYVIKGVPGRILFALLSEHAESGRTEFSNREIRLDRSIGLPAGKDNLEARLLALRRRLEERDDPFRVERVGRGKLRLTVDGPLQLDRHES